MYETAYFSRAVGKRLKKASKESVAANRKLFYSASITHHV